VTCSTRPSSSATRETPVTGTQRRHLDSGVRRNDATAGMTLRGDCPDSGGQVAHLPTLANDVWDGGGVHGAALGGRDQLARPRCHP